VGIAPTFPAGYKPPNPIKPNGSIQADHLSKRAEECRAIAAVMRDPDCAGRAGFVQRRNNPMISALAKVLKCKLKPMTAADVSAVTSSFSACTANTVNR
jgi:hypothetical protein